MKTKTTVAVVIGAALLAGTVMASTAFTSATMTRDANVNAVTDSSGEIALEVGGSPGGAVSTAANDELKIDINKINVDSTYKYGEYDYSGSSPDGKFAFKITNNAGNSKYVDLSTTSSALTFKVFDSSGSSEGTASSGNSLDNVELTSGSTLYVAIKADAPDSTGSTTGDITISADESS